MTEQLFHRHLLLSKYCFGEDFRPSDWKKVIWTTNIETTYFNFQLHSKTSNHLFTYSSNLEDSAQGHSHDPGLPPPVIRMLYMCYILLLLCITFLNIKITSIVISVILHFSLFVLLYRSSIIRNSQTLSRKNFYFPKSHLVIGFILPFIHTIHRISGIIGTEIAIYSIIFRPQS